MDLWPLLPYQLVADGTVLCSIVYVCEPPTCGFADHTGKIRPECPVSGQDQGPYILVKGILEHCQKLGLHISVRCAEDVARDMERGTTVGEIIAALIELDNTIRREMSTHWFFHLEHNSAAFYKQTELFGVEVNNKFPQIAFDMVEAGNCCAMGRGTACVFHLMRIMEVGVQAFGIKLGVSLAHEKNWQNILDETNKAIRALPPKDSMTVRLSQISSKSICCQASLAQRSDAMTHIRWKKQRI